MEALLEGEIEQHQADYEKLPTIIVSKQGAIFEFEPDVLSGRFNMRRFAGQ